MAWSDGEVEEMWQGVNLDSWNKEFVVYDTVRDEEMGREPHWYVLSRFSCRIDHYPLRVPH